MRELPTIASEVNGHSLTYSFIDWIKLISNDCLWSISTKKKYNLPLIK